MTSYEPTPKIRVSPQQAAERLTDIAYALIAGGPLQLTGDRGRVTVPLGDELRMRHDLTSDGDRVRLELQLSWSAGRSDLPGASDASADESSKVRDDGSRSRLRRCAA